jgi:DNA-directed RNA polymerase subunit RPC12/RpoP
MNRAKKKQLKALKRRAKMDNAKRPQMMGAGRKQMPRGIAPNLLPGVTHEHLTPILCKCGGIEFLQVTRLGFASKFHTVNGIPTLVSLPLGYACLECKAINDYDHPDLQRPEGQDEEDVFKCPKCNSEGFEPSESGDSCFHCDNKPEKKEIEEEIEDFETFRESLGVNVAEDIKTKEVLK